MKWLFRGIGLIFFAFASLCVIGFFSPAQLVVERSRAFDADPEDVFVLIDDLREHSAWSPWVGSGDSVFGGANMGRGMTMAWRTDDPHQASSGEVSSGQHVQSAGEQEILSSVPPDYVQTRLNIDGRVMDILYALSVSDAEPDAGLLLIKIEQDLGGFPYVQRLLGQRLKGQFSTDADTALKALSALAEDASE